MSTEARSKSRPDISLFANHVYSPSYSTLTNNFEHAAQLKDYCIPVNSYLIIAVKEEILALSAISLKVDRNVVSMSNNATSKKAS